MAKRVIEVQVIGDADSLRRTLKGARTDVDKFGKAADGAGGRSRKLGKGLAVVGKAGGAAAAGGILALGVGLKKSVDAFAEAERVAAQTNAVLKSTEGAANVTAKQVGNLATAISRKSGMDDEAIQKGENLLLTFTRIRNESGKGNKVFNQTTRAAVDMAAAMEAAGKSMSISDAALQVGKALNDPVKGMTRLQRVGVTFTEGQKAQVEALVASGQEMKAQKVILKELNKEFGGSAAAAGSTFEGSMNKAKVALGNLGEAIGAKVAPTIAKAATSATDFINKLVDGKGRPAEFRQAVVNAFEGAKRVVGTAISAVRGYLKRNEADIRQFGQAFVNIGKGIKAVFLNVILPVVRRVLPGIVQYFQGTLRVISGIVKVFTGVFTGDWRKVWAGVKQIFSGALKAIGGIMRASTAPFRAMAATIGKAISGLIGGAFQTLKGVVRGVIRFILGLLDRMLGGISSILRIAGRIPGIGDKFDAVADAIDAARQKVRGLRDGLNRVPRNLQVQVMLKAAQRGDFKPLQDPNDLFNATGGPLTKGLRNRAEEQGRKELAKAPFGQIGPLIPGTTGAASVDAFNPIAARFGNVITSGYREGDDGWHGANRARDYAGGNMMGFAKFMFANFGSKLLELIYTPMGTGIKNGRPVSISGFYGADVAADHFDHVHVAMKRGGRTRQAVRALVGEEGPEIVDLPVGAVVHPFSKSKKMIAAMQDRIAHFKKGGLASLNRTFPEHGLGEPGKFMSFDAIRRVFESQGASPREAYIFATIARGESGGGRMGGMPGIRGDDPGGTKGWGLVQNTPGVWSKNSKTYKLMQKLGGEEALRNPFVNAKVAMSLKAESGGSFDPWFGTAYMSDPGAGVASALTKGDKKWMKGGGKQTAAERKANTPVKGRSKLSLDDILEMDRTALTEAEGTEPTSDDVKAIKRIQADLGKKAKALRARLAKINKTLKGKLKPATRKRLLEERSSIFGEIGSVAGEQNTLRDTLGGFKEDRKTGREEKAEEREERQEARTGALSGIKAQMGDLASQAASAFRAGLETAIDTNLKAKLKAISEGADSTALRAVTGRQSAREDVQNERDLAKAQTRLERARAAGASPKRLEQLEAAVDEVQARILEKRIAAQEDAANKEADAAREGLDQQEADLKASLDRSLAALFGNLEQRKITYQDWVQQVRAVLGPFGVDFQGSSEDSAALAPPPASPTQKKWQDAAWALWNSGIRSGKAWKPYIDFFGYDPRRGGTLQFRAKGGPVMAGQPYVVGELGPEIFTPSQSGRVMSNRESQRAAGGITVNMPGATFRSTADVERWASRTAFKVTAGRG